MKKVIITSLILLLSLSFTMYGQFDTVVDGKTTTTDQVGIGTTSLESTQKLTVQGPVNIGGTSGARLKVRIIDGKKNNGTGIDNLYLNWNNGKHIFAGNMNALEANKSNLYVSGKVGIGTTALDGTHKLTIKGNVNIGGDGYSFLKTRFINGKSVNSVDKGDLFLNWKTGYDVYIGTHITTGATSDLFVSGKVRIGNDISTPAGYQLYVKEGILTEKIKVALKTTNDWADYVFEEDYDLNSIEEVEDFVKENKHLPNIPSAKEMVNTGLNVAEMDAKLLRQIEELWLHTIDVNKKNAELEAKYEAVLERLQELEK